MGRIPEHVWCKVLCCIFHSYLLSMDRVVLRPSGQDKDLFALILGGPDIDSSKILSSKEELVKSFYSITQRTDIVFGDLIWISKYRSEQVLLIHHWY